MRHFEELLQELFQKVVEMGTIAERMIDLALTVLVQRNEAHAAKVWELEREALRPRVQAGGPAPRLADPGVLPDDEPLPPRCRDEDAASSAGMQRLNGIYAQQFNDRTERVGTYSRAASARVSSSKKPTLRTRVTTSWTIRCALGSALGQKTGPGAAR